MATLDWSSILLGAGIGGVVLFFWYAVCWMVLPHHRADFAATPNRAALEPALADLPPRRVMYMVPFMSEFPQGMKDPALQERWKAGPNALILRTDGACGMGPRTLVQGLLGNVLEALGLSLLLALALPTIGYGTTHSLLLALGAAVFVGASGNFPLSNWMAFPWRFSATSTLDRVVGFSAAVLAMRLCGFHAPVS
ncbi:MAG: hypothetical protein R3F30_04850 [Planctomycetota bacterium]